MDDVLEKSEKCTSPLDLERLLSKSPQLRTLALVYNIGSSSRVKVFILGALL